MKKVAIVLAVLCALFFAGILGYCYWLKYGLTAIAIYVAMVLALPFSSLMHEFGHIVVGAMCKINAVPKLSLFGSSSCKIIPKTDKNLKWRVFFTAKGGVAFNALFFLLGLAALSIKDCPVWPTLFMPASIYLFILNDIPSEFAQGKNDGLICSEILNDTNEAKVMLAVLTVQAQVLNGKPIQEVEESLLMDLPVIREDDPAFISLTELRYEYFNAKGDGEQAEKCKARLEQLKEYL